MNNAHFVVVGGAKPAEYEIKLPCVIGRGRSANLTIPHPLVSRLHCKLFEKNGRLAIRDLDSLNGTYVNNERIDRETFLSPGDILIVGEIRLQSANNRSTDLEYHSAHETDLEITPESTQPIQETTVSDFDAGMKTIQGPIDMEMLENPDPFADVAADPLSSETVPRPHMGRSRSSKFKGAPPE